MQIVFVLRWSIVHFCETTRAIYAQIRKYLASKKEVDTIYRRVGETLKFEIAFFNEFCIYYIVTQLVPQNYIIFNFSSSSIVCGIIFWTGISILICITKLTTLLIQWTPTKFDPEIEAVSF